MTDVLYRRPAIGDLRERVTLQSESRAADGGGGGAVTWTDVAELWARVRAERGAEQIERGILTGVVMYRVTIRYRAGVSAGQRLLWNGTALNIRAVVNPDERGRYLELMAESGVPV